MRVIDRSASPSHDGCDRSWKERVDESDESNMSLLVAVLIVWLVALPSVFLLVAAVYPRYLRRRMERRGALAKVKPPSAHRHRARPGI